MYYLSRDKILAIRIANDEPYQIIGKDLTATMVKGITVLSPNVTAYKFVNSAIVEVMLKVVNEQIRTSYDAMQHFVSDDIIQITDEFLTVVDEDDNILVDDSGNTIILE